MFCIFQKCELKNIYKNMKVVFFRVDFEFFDNNNLVI